MTTGNLSSTPSSSKTVNHLPIKKGKHAPETFTGRFDKIAEFFDELEGICLERNVTEPKEKCKAIARYSARKVIEVIEGLKEYRDGDYDQLKKEMKFIYDSEREETRFTTADLFRIVKKWKTKKIKNLPTFKEFYKGYKRVAGWLHIRGKINDDDYKLWFWAGLHRDFRALVESRMRMDDRNLDDTKAFDVPKIVEAAQKVFTRKRFENRMKLMMERSARDSDEESDSDESDEDRDEENESDTDSESDETDAATLRAIKKKRNVKRVSFKEPEKPSEVPNRQNADTPVAELIDRMKRLRLTDKILFNEAIQADPSLRQFLRVPDAPAFAPRNMGRDIPPHMNTSGVTLYGSGGNTGQEPRRCYGCGKTDHTMNRCEEFQKKVSQGIISKNTFGRWVWKDGKEVERRRGETWLEALSYGAKHVGIVKAIRKEEEEEEDAYEEDGMVMYVEADREDDDASESEQRLLGWEGRPGGQLHYDALSAVRSERVSRNERYARNDRTGVPAFSKEVTRTGVRREGKPAKGQPFPFAKSADARGRDGGVATSLAPDHVMEGTNDDHKIFPTPPIFKASGDVLAKKEIKDVGEEVVDVVRARAEARATRKEEMSDLSKVILEKPITLPLRDLMRLVPQLPRALGEESKGFHTDPGTGYMDPGTLPPKNEHKKEEKDPKKVFLHQTGARPTYGIPRETLVSVPARVGRARMTAVIDSGAMVDVISEKMFLASGLARNSDTSMQIGDANGGMKSCKGMIKNATIYLTDEDCPTKGDLWVHENTGAYDLLLGRRWATKNWGGTVEEPEGTLLKFASQGQEITLNAVPRDDEGHVRPRVGRVPEEDSLSKPRTQEPQEVYVVEAWKGDGEEGNQKRSDQTTRPGTYGPAIQEGSEESEEEEWMGIVEEEEEEEDEPSLRYSTSGEETYPEEVMDEELDSETESSQGGSEVDDWWEERMHGERRGKWKRDGGCADRKQGCDEGKERRRRRKGEKEQEQDGRGRKSRGNESWLKDKRDEDEGEERNDEENLEDERSFNEESADELIRLVLEGRGHQTMETHPNRYSRNKIRPTMRRPRTPPPQSGGRRSTLAEQPTEHEETLTPIQIKKGQPREENSQEDDEFPRNQAAEHASYLPKKTVRRSRRERDPTWGSRQQQWERTLAEKTSVRVAPKAARAQAQHRTPQILLSIARRKEPLGQNESANGIAPDPGDVSPTSKEPAMADPFSDASPSARANKRLEEREGDESRGEIEFGRPTTPEAEPADRVDANREPQGNSLMAAGSKDASSHEIVRMNDVGLESTRMEDKSESTKDEEGLIPTSILISPASAKLIISPRCVSTLHPINELTLIDLVFKVRAPFYRSQLLVYQFTFLFRLTARLYTLYPFHFVVYPPFPTVSKHFPIMTVEPNEETSHSGPGLPTATLSASPPRNFFHMVFGGSEQGLLVPITYGTAEEGRARLKAAEIQIRQAARNPDGLKPATARISHLHELMTHYFSNGAVIRDFLGMGATIFASSENGTKTAYTGDLFIRFVPRSPQPDNFPEIHYPDPRAVQQMHQGFTTAHCFTDDVIRVNDPTFRMAVSNPMSAVSEGREDSPFKADRNPEEARKLSDQRLEEAAEEVRERIRACINLRPLNPTADTPPDGESDSSYAPTDESTDEESDTSMDGDETDYSAGESPPPLHLPSTEPLPDVPYDSPTAEDFAMIDFTNNELEEGEVRLDSHFDHEKLMADKFPRRYFETPHRVNGNPDSSPPPSSLPSLMSSTTSSSDDSTTVITCDDGRAFVPIVFENKEKEIPSKNVVACFRMNAPPATPAPFPPAASDKNPFQPSTLDPRKTKISSTTAALFEAAGNPVSANVPKKFPSPTVEEVEDMDTDTPSPSPAPYHVPVEQRAPVCPGNQLDPNATPFRPSLPRMPPYTAPPEVAGLAGPTMFPVTAHFLASTVTRLHDAEFSIARLEKEIRDCKEVNKTIMKEAAEDHKRIGEICWLYGRVDEVERQIGILHARITKVKKDQPPRDDYFEKEVDTWIDKIRKEVATIRINVQNQGGGLANDVASLRKSFNEMQVKQAMDRAVTIKDVMELRKAVFTEYRDRFNRLESTFRLTCAQIKANLTSQAKGNNSLLRKATLRACGLTPLTPISISTTPISVA